MEKEYEGWEFYQFSFEDTSGSMNPFSKNQIDKVSEQIQSFLSFEIQSKFKLSNGADTSSCLQFHYERLIGMSPQFKFLCGFKIDKKNPTRMFLYEDVLFQNGTIKFRMDDKISISPKVVIK
jgi:hypothetical protein